MRASSDCFEFSVVQRLIDALRPVRSVAILAKQTVAWVSVPVFLSIATMNPIAIAPLDQSDQLSAHSFRHSDKRPGNAHRFEPENF